MDEAELALFLYLSLSFCLVCVSPACLAGCCSQFLAFVSSQSLYSLIRVSRGSVCEFVCTNLILGSLWRSRGAHSAALRSLGHSLLLEWGPGMCAVARVCVGVHVCVSASQELTVFAAGRHRESGTKRVFQTKARQQLVR